MRDGIEEWEKLRLLRESNHGTLPKDLEELLERFRDPKTLGDDEEIIRDVEAMREAIEQAARKVNLTP